ncbi:hypothetical protein QYE76_053488 [Lolium multiflorum]|uniref:Uncharacterized protein n=1 Tax=Lolium multiflorum TaxID=4521 RepID=A0AAD8SWG6_LOLMU|nr:hypothetical protein QYE76_053488 [Lolium multiflorum]
MGSSVSQYEIDWLHRSRRIPEGVSCRIRDEIEPVPNPGERVVFLAHFERGGLPVSSFSGVSLIFTNSNLTTFRNAIFYLSCYVTFMEAYIGIRPTRETFARFFALRINSVQGLDIPKPKPPYNAGLAKDRFPGIESDRRGRCRKRGLDKFDPDPVIFWRDSKMGRTPARLGKSPPEPADVPSANIKPQVHEHVAPLQAEAGQEFVDKLMAQGKKNKTPPLDAGSSQPPPAKRFRTEPLAGKVVAVRRHKGKQMPTATGPALKLGSGLRALPALPDLNSSSSFHPAPSGAANLRLPSGAQQPLVLHVGPAAAVVQHKPSGLLGRIVELKREGKDLGHLLPYAQKWNDADISAATRGLGKDRLPAPDPAGPRSTEEHFTRLKHAVKEFDSARARTTPGRLFSRSFFGSRDLAEAHNKCQAIPEASIEALKEQVAALQEGLGRPKEISRELKDQLCRPESARQRAEGR